MNRYQQQLQTSKQQQQLQPPEVTKSILMVTSSSSSVLVVVLLLVLFFHHHHQANAFCLDNSLITKRHQCQFSRFSGPLLISNRIQQQHQNQQSITSNTNNNNNNNGKIIVIMNQHRRSSSSSSSLLSLHAVRKQQEQEDFPIDLPTPSSTKKKQAYQEAASSSVSILSASKSSSSSSSKLFKTTTTTTTSSQPSSSSSPPLIRTKTNSVSYKSHASTSAIPSIWEVMAQALVQVDRLDTNPTELQRYVQYVTLFRVGLPSLALAVAAKSIYPSIAMFLAHVVIHDDPGVFAVVAQDAAQYIQNILTTSGLIFSLLVGQTYYFMYQQQEAIYLALFDEVTVAKSLLEQVALVCQGRDVLYRRILTCIDQYVQDDLTEFTIEPAVLLSRRPVDDPLEDILYLTSVGVPSSIYSTVRSLRQARAARLGALQRKLPNLHMILLWSLAFIVLFTFPLLGAAVQTIGGMGILHVQAWYLSFIVFGISMTLGVINELRQPEGRGAYNVVTVLAVMVQGLEQELQGRLLQIISNSETNNGGGGNGAGGGGTMTNFIPGPTVDPDHPAAAYYYYYNTIAEQEMQMTRMMEFDDDDEDDINDSDNNGEYLDVGVGNTVLSSSWRRRDDNNRNGDNYGNDTSTSVVIIKQRRQGGVKQAKSNDGVNSRKGTFWKSIFRRRRRRKEEQDE